MNHKLLEALFADPEAWRSVSLDDDAPAALDHRPTAAAAAA